MVNSHISSGKNLLYGSFGVAVHDRVKYTTEWNTLKIAQSRYNAILCKYIFSCLVTSKNLISLTLTPWDRRAVVVIFVLPFVRNVLSSFLRYHLKSVYRINPPNLRDECNMALSHTPGHIVSGIQFIPHNLRWNYIWTIMAQASSSTR